MSRGRRIALVAALAGLATVPVAGIQGSSAQVPVDPAQEAEPDLFLQARGKLAISPSGRSRCRSARVRIEVLGDDRDLAQDAVFTYRGRPVARDFDQPLSAIVVGLRPRRGGMRRAGANVTLPDGSVVELETTLRLCPRPRALS